MKTGESVNDAALRAIREGLGSRFQLGTTEKPAKVMFGWRGKDDGSSSKTDGDGRENFRSKLQLGDKADVVAQMIEETYLKKEEKKAAGEYPGLTARYVTHEVDAVVDGLPESEFSTQAEEFGESNEYPEAAEKTLRVVRHYWKWSDHILWDNFRVKSKFQLKGEAYLKQFFSKESV